MVVAAVRRRVPQSDAEDVVQAVYCDALAASRLPPPAEIRPWLLGIARHKIVDYFRARERSQSDQHAAASIAEAHAALVPFEAREILRRIEDEHSDPRLWETLSWLVREHQGEPLAAIAARERVPATTVRQRVSRLRRALRSRWGAVVAAVVMLAIGWRLASRDSEPLIVSDHDQSVATSSSAVARAQGAWSVERYETDDTALQAALATEARGARIIVSANQVVVVTALQSRAFSFESAARDGELRGRLVDGSSVVTLRGRFASDDRLVLDLEGPTTGRFVLQRSR